MSSLGAIYNPESATLAAMGDLKCGCFSVPKWYAVRTKPRQESRANDQLQQAGLETFLPLYKSRPNICNAVHALFTSYLFARTQPESIGLINKCYGVSYVVNVAGEPAEIQPAIIDSIREGTDQQGYFTANELKIGDKAIILSGAYEGKEGIVSRILRENLLQLIVNESLKWSVELSKFDVVRA